MILLKVLFSDSSPRGSDAVGLGLGSRICVLTSLPEDADTGSPKFDLDLGTPGLHLSEGQTLPN